MQKETRQLKVMISSTALDLPDHRKQVIESCLSQEILPIGMEHLPARDVTGVQASLEMVDKADVYVGLYAWRYGWVPEFNNPDQISITEMEFNRALERKKSGELKEVLVFLMGETHPILPSDFENGVDAQKKLTEFKKRASTGRVTLTFSSKEELRGQVIQSLADLKTRLQPPPSRTAGGSRSRKKGVPIPEPPTFYAEPNFIVSNRFIGRESQLQELNDWAMPAEPHTVLLFEAIGGNGKSMLTWEWTNHRATSVRSDWAGRFWYSFYERGAVMADFCQRALAYMTNQPVETFSKQKTPELARELLLQLQAKPWLLILDGLERVLVAYHRIDAAEVPDEEANQPTDKIASRDPCSAIRDEDDDLLRALAAAAPSKILISSRLTPRVHLNNANQAIPGVRRISLPGLRPPDAEELLRSFDITGESDAIQSYLSTNCDCHPLVIAILAGLIKDYFPDKGNFDAWAADADGGGQLNLASLDLIQRRNHILRAAMSALPEKSSELLSMLALMPESIDYRTLCAINPHLPPEPEEVYVPTDPREHWRWKHMEQADREVRERVYDAALQRRRDYDLAVKARLESTEYRLAPKELGKTVRDLVQRGLMQYDGRIKRYDLHPVVRGVAVGGLQSEEKEKYGKRVVDFFFQQTHNPYEEAETIFDVKNDVNLIRALVRIGNIQAGASTYRGDLSHALLFNLEDYTGVVSLIRPFFSEGWGVLPPEIGVSDGSYLANEAAYALRECGLLNEALAAGSAALVSDLSNSDLESARIDLYHISRAFGRQNRLASEERCLKWQLDLADHSREVFVARIDWFLIQSERGRWDEADEMWALLDPMGRSWPRHMYRPGDAERRYARSQFWRGTLEDVHLNVAIGMASAGKNRAGVRDVHGLRGRWRLQRGEWELAAASYQEAVRMARESGILDSDAETGLSLAKFQMGTLANPGEEAERLAHVRNPSNYLLALLWRYIGDEGQARSHALKAYKWAWADGTPYVHRYELDKAAELLHELGLGVPHLAPYDPAKDEKLPWEEAILEAIEKVRARKGGDQSADDEGYDDDDDE